jgi:hypothetical protein
MLEALAEQIRAEMVYDIHQEIERAYQELVQLEKYHHRPRPIKSVSKHEQPLLPPTTLKDVIKDAIYQASRKGYRRKRFGFCLQNALKRNIALEFTRSR